MTDIRVERFADVLVRYSTKIVPGDRVLISATTAAEPLVRELYKKIIEVGGHPQVLMEFPEQNEILITKGNDDQLNFKPPFLEYAYDHFESRISIMSSMNPRALGQVDPARLGKRQSAMRSILETQMRRGGTGELKWNTTLYPTEGYAKEAGMSLKDYEDFVFNACHVNESDPVAFWKKVQADQEEIVKRVNGHEWFELKGPNVDLKISTKGRTFVNCCGDKNMPDGEVFTGPVENSASGWVKYTYPAIYNGVAVEGIELVFEEGKVVKATAEKNEKFLLQMLDSDAGSRYLGEFAIGTNFDITKFTGNILFDEKIGGSFHMALGAGYPETGSTNKSVIHWDMICDMRTDSEIRIDGDLLYKNGKFI